VESGKRKHLLANRYQEGDECLKRTVCILTAKLVKLARSAFILRAIICRVKFLVLNIGGATGWIVGTELSGPCHYQPNFSCIK